MASWRARWFVFAAGLAGVLVLSGSDATAEREGHDAEGKDMRLVGHEPLQARSAYQPVIHRQGDRWIAYVGHHAERKLNSLTGVEEPNGTSIVDVTSALRPRCSF